MFVGLFVAEVNVPDLYVALSHLICVFNFSCIAFATSGYRLSLLSKINKTCSNSLPHFNLLFQITCKLENQMIKPTGIWGDVKV